MSHHWRKTRWWKADGEKKPKTEVDDASRLEKKNKQTKRTRQTPLVRPCKDSASQKWDAPSFSGLTQLERSAGFFFHRFLLTFYCRWLPFSGLNSGFFCAVWSGSYGVSNRFLGCCSLLTLSSCVLPGVTGFYRVSLCFTGFHCVLPGFTGFYWVLLGFTWFYWVLLGFTGLH